MGGSPPAHPTPERRLLEARAAVFERVRARIAQRLARVCQDMTSAEFDAMVHRAAEIQIKYELRRQINAFNN